MLQIVSVTDLTTQQTYWFDANMWFDSKQVSTAWRIGMGQMMRHMPALAGSMPGQCSLWIYAVISTSTISAKLCPPSTLASCTQGDGRTERMLPALLQEPVPPVPVQQRKTAQYEVRC